MVGWSNRRGSGRVGGMTEGGAGAAQSGRAIKRHVCGVVLRESYPTACEEQPCFLLWNENINMGEGEPQEETRLDGE